MRKDDTMDKLDSKTIEKMKEMVDNRNPEWSWRITNFCMGDYCIQLDDGDQSYFTFHFDKNKHSAEDISKIAHDLAQYLNVPCDFYVSTQTTN